MRSDDREADTRSDSLFTESGSGRLRRRRYHVEVIAGPDQGKREVIERGTLLIGAHLSNGLQLTEASISRYHLELAIGPYGLRVVDLNSSHGTYEGEVRVNEIIIDAAVQLRLGRATVLAIAPEDLALDAEPSVDVFGEAVGGTPAMRELFGLLTRVAAAHATVLIEGETGTGKELLARGVHEHSPRRGKPFVVVDCGATPAELIGSELFGHVRGAFTGADRDRRGLFVEADGGTLFLDEIGELPLELQPQLLRVLERRELRPLGAAKPRKVDVRIVAATHRNLVERVRAGRFRADLYYRLSVVRVKVPPLRDRREDLPRLVRACLAELDAADFELSADALAQLMAYDWPGNVRELRNVIEAGVALRERPELDGVDAGAVGAATDVFQPLRDDPSALPFKEAKDRMVAAFEREYLVHLLARHGGNLSRAAVAAKLDRGHLRLLVRKHAVAARDD